MNAHKIDGMPDAGTGRFWHAVHQPKNTKLPMLLELREKTTDSPRVLLSFSRLISQLGTIADPKSIIATATEILERAGRVDDFVGVLEAS